MTKLIVRVHAIKRMSQRGITVEDVESIIRTGKVIASYPNDAPYPSNLFLGYVGPRPMHVVLAENSVDDESVVITVYEPDTKQWDQDFVKRRGT